MSVIICVYMLVLLYSVATSFSNVLHVIAMVQYCHQSTLVKQHNLVH